MNTGAGGGGVCNNVPSYLCYSDRLLYSALSDNHIADHGVCMTFNFQFKLYLKQIYMKLIMILIVDTCS